MGWAGSAYMGEERGCIGSWWGNRRERDHLGSSGSGMWGDGLDRAGAG